MEKITITKDLPEYNIYKNDVYNVLRTINNECVVILPTKPNFICTENKLRQYGTLTGTPVLGGN